jgi:hypothetical protein
MLLYISKGRLYRVDGGKPAKIRIASVEKYISTIKEMRNKKEWKSSGTGAHFMGMNLSFDTDPEESITISGIAPDGDGGFIYSSVFDGNMAIYRNDHVGSDDEGVILRKNSVQIHEVNILPDGQKIIASGSENFQTKHIVLINKEKSDLQFLTEGDSIDSNPVFSKTEPNIVFFDSKGIGSDYKGALRLSSSGILQLNLETGDLDEYITDETNDYFKPKTDSNGNLYYIRRPYKTNLRSKMSLKDVALIPFKFFRAIFGWMDFFTRKYSGEALNTKGNNPSKAKQLSEKELFVEGNLINAEENLRKNKASGEKYPGFIPKSWVLVRRSPDGQEQVIKKGVIDYCVTDDAIYFSNGKCIIRLQSESSDEEMVCEAELAQNLTWNDVPLSSSATR